MEPAPRFLAQLRSTELAWATFQVRGTDQTHSELGATCGSIRLRFTRRHTLYGWGQHPLREEERGGSEPFNRFNLWGNVQTISSKCKSLSLGSQGKLFLRASHSSSWTAATWGLNDHLEGINTPLVDFDWGVSPVTGFRPLSEGTLILGRLYQSGLNIEGILEFQVGNPWSLKLPAQF